MIFILLIMKQAVPPFQEAQPACIVGVVMAYAM